LLRSGRFNGTGVLTVMHATVTSGEQKIG